MVLSRDILIFSYTFTQLTWGTPRPTHRHPQAVFCSSDTGTVGIFPFMPYWWRNSNNNLLLPLVFRVHPSSEDKIWHLFGRCHPYIWVKYSCVHSCGCELQPHSQEGSMDKLCAGHSSGREGCSQWWHRVPTWRTWKGEKTSFFIYQAAVCWQVKWQDILSKRN